VLGLVVADLSYRAFPDLPEGELARRRSATVNEGVLAEVATELGVGDAVMLGKGEEQSGGRGKASILADAMEALLGAVYLDGGIREAFDVIERLFWPRMLAYVRGEGARDYKSHLQELTAQSVGRLPEYRVQDRGPDHRKEFTATVFVAGEPYGRGEGRSKKEAEQRAAREAFARLTSEQGGGPGGDGEAAAAAAKER